MAETTTIDVFLIVDEDGNFEVGTDESKAGERFNDAHSGYLRKCHKLNLTIPLPKLAEVSGTLTVNEGEHTLTIS